MRGLRGLGGWMGGNFFQTGEKVFPNGGEIIRREGRILKLWEILRRRRGGIEKKRKRHDAKARCHFL